MTPTGLEIVLLSALLALALAVPGVILALSWWLHRSKHRVPDKDLPYECGLRNPLGGAGGRFSVRFYLVAMAFLVFDIETVFILPWAASFRPMGAGPLLLVEMGVFLAVLAGGYLYLLGKGALDWE